MLSRRFIAAAVLATGLAVTAAVPAVAATSAPSTSTQTPSPAPGKVVKVAPDLACVISVDRSGKRTIEIKPATSAPSTAKQAEECKALLARRAALPVPKGAPQTGGGGMAAEVSSWG